MRVLLVEDDPITRSVVEQVLRARGHWVVSFEDAESAWEAYQRELFPLAILDWVLPGMDGLELCRRIRALPRGDACVVVLVTARDRPEDLVAVLGAGASDYLPKPFDASALEVRLAIAEKQVASIWERKRAEEALEYQALHDPLTGLPNRTLLRDRLRQALLAARRLNSTVALLVMDLDHFKEINDTLGHMAGDSLLQQVAQRLRGALRESDTVARLGGDEFAAVLPGADQRGAIAAAGKLIQVVEQPVQAEGQTLQVNLSVGIALSPQHGEDDDTLLRRADLAMYVAKHARSGYAVYAFDQEQQAPGRLELASELRRSISDGQLVLHFQPQLELRSGRLRGLEALVRWHHPRHGLLPPSHFLPLAEQTGLIRSLSEWVLSAALDRARALREMEAEARLVVNLSARDLHDPRLPESVAELLQAHGTPTTLLELEITESALMANPARAMESLTRLRHVGVAVTIDDFGTGYSSLGYLQRLPVTGLKVDRSFVLRMSDDDNDRAVVRTAISLGHSLGLRVIAEGVESRAAWDLLVSLDCDAAQGNFICPPLPFEAFERWGRERGPLPPAS